MQPWQTSTSVSPALSLVPVEVVEDPPSTTVTLVSPTDWRIEGLQLALVAQLLRGPG